MGSRGIEGGLLGVRMDKGKSKRAKEQKSKRAKEQRLGVTRLGRGALVCCASSRTGPSRPVGRSSPDAGAVGVAYGQERTVRSINKTAPFSLRYLSPSGSSER